MLLDWFICTLHVNTFVATVLQVYVFYLIQTRSPPSMQEYKFFLTYFTFFDLIFTIIIGVLLTPEPTGHQVSLRVHGLASLIGPRAELISIAAMIYSGAVVLLTQDYCLIYRYSAIHESKQFQQFFVSGFAKLACCIFSQIYSIGTGLLVYNVFVPPEKFNSNYLTGPALELYNRIVQPGEFLVWPDVTTEYYRIFAVVAFSFFIVVEGFAVYMIYSILSILKSKTKKFSRNTYKLHFQLTLLLAVQLMLPIALIILPVSIKWVRVFLGYDETPFFSRLRVIFISLYGPVNSSFTILFVSPYRNHFYNHLIYPWLKPLLICLHLEKMMPRRKSTTAWTTQRLGVIPVASTRSSADV